MFSLTLFTRKSETTPATIFAIALANENAIEISDVQSSSGLNALHIAVVSLY